MLFVSDEVNYDNCPRYGTLSLCTARLSGERHGCGSGRSITRAILCVSLVLHIWAALGAAADEWKEILREQGQQGVRVQSARALRCGTVIQQRIQSS